MEHILTLPWPPSILSPNSRKHWRAKAPIKSKYRYACGILAMANRPKFAETGDIKLTITFHPPDKRLRDDDNMIGSFKAGRDGIADGWGVNDRRFKPTYVFGDPIKDGKITIEITP